MTPESAAAWRAAGVNRVSLGAQSFDPAVLAWMHRTHTRGADRRGGGDAAARRHRETSRSISSSVCPRPWAGAGAPIWTTRSRSGPITCRSTASPSRITPRSARWTARGEVDAGGRGPLRRRVPRGRRQARRAGYEHYEVSNYARPGRRARHNSAYWRRAPFIGLGPSAHSGWGEQRAGTCGSGRPTSGRWPPGESPVAGTERLDAEAVQLEELYLGLRTQEGVPVDRLPPETGRAWIRPGGRRLGAPAAHAEGWLRLDALGSTPRAKSGPRTRTALATLGTEPGDCAGSSASRPGRATSRRLLHPKREPRRRL